MLTREKIEALAARDGLERLRQVAIDHAIRELDDYKAAELREVLAEIYAEGTKGFRDYTQAELLQYLLNEFGEDDDLEAEFDALYQDADPTDDSDG